MTIYSLADQTVRDAGSYDDACAWHRWKVPPAYSIAHDICDRHADGRGRRALVWDDPARAGATYSFDDLKRLSDRLAGGLRALGVGRGTRVAFMLPQLPEHALALVAVLKLGAVAVPLSRLFGPDAVRYRLADSEASAVFTDGENVAKIREIRGEAFILLKPGHVPSPALADALATQVKQRLGTFQRPREIEWVTELPMTVSGKVKRGELRRAALSAAAKEPA
jgi:acyl-coenzyme A synthetase/AMP-(fatty) acid ligase